MWDELHRVRNIRPSFRLGMWAGLAYSAIDTYLFRGRAPWTFHNHADYNRLARARRDAADRLPARGPTARSTYDRLTSVSFSFTNHLEGQPAHRKMRDPEKAISINYRLYDSPEQRYCPAGVYEIVDEGPGDGPTGGKRLQINAQNCVHCKTCDIKDPEQNIDWVVPEGGGGLPELPEYVRRERGMAGCGR